MRMSETRRRYLRRLWPTWLIYIGALIASKWLLDTQAVAGTARYVVAVAPALPLVAVVFFIGQLMYGKEDEFQRALWAEAMLWGTAVTLAATTVWGFLESAGALHIPLYWVFPFWTGAALASIPFLARKYA
jgi:hypothetical protein